MKHKSVNFQFLAKHDSHLLKLGAGAEAYCLNEPDIALTKIRQLTEAIAFRLGRFSSRADRAELKLIDIINQLRADRILTNELVDAFHTIRRLANDAVHTGIANKNQALHALKLIRSISVWYHRLSYPDFKAGAFIPPPAPEDSSIELKKELEALKASLIEEHQSRAAAENQIASLEQAKKDAEAQTKLAYDDLQAALDLAEETEDKLKQAQSDFLKQEAAKEPASKEEQTILHKASAKAASAFLSELDEAETRAIIDEQLRSAGWETDTQNLRYSKGARPEKNKNKAIAEWPTEGRQSADYILFIGLTPIAVVEAKRGNTNVAGKIPQAERYSQGFKCDTSMTPAWETEGKTIAWPDSEEGHFHIPFAYSCNGRAFIKQLAERSGIWFRDLRARSNIRKPLQRFHSPQGLLDQLTRSKEAAERKLQSEGLDYLGLRPYQVQAIHEVEDALRKDSNTCLLAMATGTGKTRTILGLIYRFLKAERFKRILFLVDRTALGEQAMGVFKEAPLEQNQSLSKIYNIAELGDMASEAETRVHVATVQAMVKRIFHAETPPTIDEYDCIIVDEAHRGYTLDQEMTEGELSNRDAAQYLSTYRRVIDYFDAFKLGLTATPAKHTSEIFGKPVFTYSYREAVADDWLIDHEPPFTYKTQLAEKGIKIEKGEQVEFINTLTGKVETSELEDELAFEVESFNRRVIAKQFNEVICEQLAQEIDPFGEEKTLIFCVTDLHADMVKNLFDNAFRELYEDSYNEAAVRKITGKSDKVDELIRRYKNERYPSIAITVDLLTTGIDVPRICNLVFMRLVRSRILYEQMIGRATRRCDEIGKTIFKIYDAVDIYSTLQEVSTMKPLVKNPNITLEQLIDELTDDTVLKQASTSYDEPGVKSHADAILDQISQKIMRVLRKAAKVAEEKPNLRDKLSELEELWGVRPETLHKHLKSLGPHAASDFLKKNHNLLNQLNEVKLLLGSKYYPVISEAEDKITLREQNYGTYNKPEDYLDSFSAWIQEHINESAALNTVVNRPRDLTREQLKEVKLLLDEAGFSEAKLSTAWRNQSNQEIAASIIGYIRQAAMGEPLIAFEQRVQNAMTKIYQSHAWTTIQLRWLDRLAKQLSHEKLIDSEFVNKRFADDGGYKRINKIMNNQLDQVLSDLNNNLWEAS